MKWVSFSSFDQWRKKLEKKGWVKTGRPQGAAPSLPAALVRSLTEAYPRADCYRREKVFEIKDRIARGDYHISGRDIVDKWFPLTAENQTTD
jgi:hypothetical protein